MPVGFSAYNNTFSFPSTIKAENTTMPMLRSRFKKGKLYDQNIG
jgi:hypothetical protein